MITIIITSQGFSELLEEIKIILKPGIYKCEFFFSCKNLFLTSDSTNHHHNIHMSVYNTASCFKLEKTATTLHGIGKLHVLKTEHQ